MLSVGVLCYVVLLVSSVLGAPFERRNFRPSEQDGKAFVPTAVFEKMRDNRSNWYACGLRMFRLPNPLVNMETKNNIYILPAKAIKSLFPPWTAALRVYESRIFGGGTQWKVTIESPLPRQWAVGISSTKSIKPLWGSKGFGFNGRDLVTFGLPKVAVNGSRYGFDEIEGRWNGSRIWPNYPDSYTSPSKDVVLIYVEMQFLQSSVNTKVWFVHNNIPLGQAFDVYTPYGNPTMPLYPVVQFFRSGAVAHIERVGWQLDPSLKQRKDFNDIMHYVTGFWIGNTPDSLRGFMINIVRAGTSGEQYEIKCEERNTHGVVFGCARGPSMNDAHTILTCNARVVNSEMHCPVNVKDVMLKGASFTLAVTSSSESMIDTLLVFSERSDSLRFVRRVNAFEPVTSNPFG